LLLLALLLLAVGNFGCGTIAKCGPPPSRPLFGQKDASPAEVRHGQCVEKYWADKKREEERLENPKERREEERLENPKERREEERLETPNERREEEWEAAPEIGLLSGIGVSIIATTNNAGIGRRLLAALEAAGMVIGHVDFNYEPHINDYEHGKNSIEVDWEVSGAKQIQLRNLITHILGQELQLGWDFLSSVFTVRLFAD
jgi:hypothetical protein